MAFDLIIDSYSSNHVMIDQVNFSVTLHTGKKFPQNQVDSKYILFSLETPLITPISLKTKFQDELI